MFNVKQAKKPVIKKVLEPVKEPPKKKPLPQRHPSLSTPAQALARDAARRSPAVKSRPTTNGHSNGLKPRSKPSPAVRTPAPLKRKRPGTPLQVLSSDSEGDDDFSTDGEVKRRKQAPKVDSLEPDTRRDIWTTSTLVSAEDIGALIHGADLTSGKHKAATGIGPELFNPAFGIAEGEEVPVLELQYPSAAPPERFQLVYPKDGSEYRPLYDIVDTIEAILTHYFPPSQSATLTDESTGIPRRLRVAFKAVNLSDFRAVVDEFNTLMRTSLKDGTIIKHLSTLHQVPITLIERILECQTYERTIAPHVAELKVPKKDLKETKNNVYGEIKPRFAHDIFRETKLRSGQVFIDLGSGVGNVAVQAALETGAESWGIEIMPKPAMYAVHQKHEFEARCKLWGIRPGAANLVTGDFLASPEIDNVLKRADVVLVNNRVFEADLNNKLVMKFLDLKEGCQIVSLEPFVTKDHKISERNSWDPKNLLRFVKEMHYGSDRVSWSNDPGEWWMAVKDSEPMRKFGLV
ncbi:DOT1-domain-containing protein [Rhizodiscina lignyota]|uniref:Histone-lysine N-methyltransferase, H3 lysine-79 specific n=1 Tax=Rhizodiscina lignyota TaxID=1504668 RepID=A0A9P4IT60_9PEZI|nr:DOT1-domain-containing protein [Rhizodiscina lignyota]